MGPSNSGKSTLAAAIARKSGHEAIHLDQLHHVPGSNWLPRPAKEFEALHRQAVAMERWVIEGNYSRLLPERLARATGFILLDVSAPISLMRYVRRSLFETKRYGALEGTKDRVRWQMIRRLLTTARQNRARYKLAFEELALPKVLLETPRSLEAFYRVNGLVG